MKKVIFICGLGHSGTTALHFMLGGHARFVALGEVYGVVSPESTRLSRDPPIRCACGDSVHECEFWRPLVNLFLNDKSLDAAQRYERFLERFTEFFGDDRVPIDSSKDVAALRTLAQVGPSIRAIYMIRDVRSWVLSMRTRRTSKSAQSSSARLFWRWFRNNRREQQALHTSGVPWIRLGYEELCLYPRLAIRSLAQFLEEELEDGLEWFADSSSHSILANRMKVDSAKMRGIQYDNRWFWQSQYWQAPSLLFPHIMRYNAREVYTNLATPFNHGLLGDA